MNVPSELREIVEAAVHEAKSNIACIVGDHTYERGDVKRLKKWRARLKDRQKVLAWLDSVSPAK